MATKIAVLVAAVLTLLLRSGGAQEAAGAPRGTLSEVNHLPWPHIGSPRAAGAPSAEVDQWRREAAAFGSAFEAIKGSWTGEDAGSADELRARVRQYEDLVRTVTSSPGYGNALLADCLRRLSLTLTVEFALAHPAENEAIGEILKSDRAALLDSIAVHGMLSEELKLPPPPGGWRLTDSRQDLDSVFQCNGTTYRKEMDRVFWSVPGTSALVTKCDVYALLFRIIGTEAVERVGLSGLVEFRRLGGRLEDLDPNDARTFMRVMERDMRKFRFPPAGISMLGGQHLLQLKEDFDPHGKRGGAFAKLALE